MSLLSSHNHMCFFIMGLSCAMQAQAVSDLPGLCKPWMGWLCMAAKHAHCQVRHAQALLLGLQCISARTTLQRQPT